MPTILRWILKAVPWLVVLARRDCDQVGEQTTRSWLKLTSARRFSTPLSGDLGLWTRFFFSLFLLASFFRC